ncbi:MAG: (4Fe-4S)-binding protein [Ignavibacteriae bacterium]|nr:(4Fe-4S)-binding protein [Ignavibacteriota bacterium]
MNERTITTKYTNGDVTVVWQPHKCIHSAICARGLPTVFRPAERPWVVIDGASTEAIVEQVKKCPSGALSYFMNDALASVQSAEEEND